jgi:hypothetical protein
MKIACGNCGGKIALPGGFAKAKIRCGLCGYYAEVPPDMRSAAPPDEDEAPPPKPKVKAKARPAPPPVDDEDDSPPPPPKKRPAAPPSPPGRTVVQPIDEDEDEDDTPPPADRPPPVRARPKANPRDTRPEFAPQAGAGQPLLEGNQDEDDPTPYGVEGDGLKRCPECHGELPHDATLCIHCGVHLDGDNRPVRKRPKKKRTYTPIDRSFGEGFPLPTRVGIMGGVLVLNVLLITVGVFTVEGGKPGAAGVITGAFTFVVNSALQAFIIGTFDTLRVQRNEKGKGTLSRQRRVGFIPLAPEVVEWKHLTGVGRLATHSGGIIDWVTCVYLLVATGCLPGILFWWFVLKPERYHAVLCNLYGGVEETLFRGKDQAQAEEVVEVVAEATGLDVKGVL